eukprot:PITA_25447
MDKVVELLCEYQDVFPTKFSNLKGIVGDLGVMKITLKMVAMPVKQRPYWLNPTYKEKVHQEVDKTMDVDIIEPVEESHWVSPMVVQEKKQKGEIRICVDLRALNDACVHDPFPTPFTGEVLDNVGRQEVYSFTDGFLGYHQIKVSHVVSKQGLMVDPVNIVVIVNLEAPTNVKQLRATLGHIGYYKKFIKEYSEIITSMEKLMKKDVMFCWDEDYQCSLDVLKEKMVTSPILVFPDWKKKFHVHVYASCIVLGAVLMQAVEEEISHLITNVNRKLSKAEKNYSTTEEKG